MNVYKGKNTIYPSFQPMIKMWLLGGLIGYKIF